jgi:hypothetical protein
VNRYSLTHVPDPVLLRDLRTLLAQDRATTALLIAHLAEVDARRLYAPAGHPSMFAYCVLELNLSEDAAYKRIQVARTARRFPAIFTALAQGRLHLSGAVLLAPHLTEANAESLLAEAARKSKSEIEESLVRRFPRSGLLPLVQSLPGAAPQPHAQLAPGQVHHTDRQLVPEPVGSTDGPSAPGRMGTTDPQLAPERVGPRVAPLAPGRYGLQLTVGQETYKKLRHAQALLGHTVPSGDLAEVLDRALDALIHQLEQRKFAATDRPRPRRRTVSRNPRHIPAEVKRAVWQRDGGRCTFVSAAGHRCEARARLEFDHIEPVARGGTATEKGVRLRCRAHNQYAAECEFGAGFMSRKREAARCAAEEARARAAVATEQARVRKAATEEVVPWLQALGLRASEARHAAARCEAIPDAPLEERVRCALSGLARPGRGHVTPSAQPAT